MKGREGGENKNYCIQFYHLNEHKLKSKATDKMSCFFNLCLFTSSQVNTIWAENKNNFKARNQSGEKAKDTCCCQHFF